MDTKKNNEQRENRIEEVLAQKYANTTGILVCKNGEVQYENYRNDCEKTDTFHVFSVTKSIVSLLIGIALDEGKIQTIEQHVLDFFPEYKGCVTDDVVSQVTIRDMMTMTVPYQCKENPYAEYFSSMDWVKASFAAIGGEGKIGEFCYAPLIGPDVLTGILTRATGQSVLDYATKKVFRPLGISDKQVIMFHSAEEQMEYYNKKNVNGWVADPQGTNTAAWGLSLNATDMIKIGELYRNHGMYGDRQIVSSKWIVESTRKQSVCTAWNLSYGYLWWQLDEQENTYAAMGDGGNTIYVNEKKGLVVALTASFVPEAGDRIQFIKECIEPLYCD